MKISVRICYQDEQAVTDIDHSTVSFESLLNLLQTAFASDSICAFEYTDEDGDTITVRSNKEMPVFLMHLLEVAADGAEVAIRARNADERHRIGELALSLPGVSLEASPRNDGSHGSDPHYVDTTLSSGASKSSSGATVNMAVKPHRVSSSSQRNSAGEVAMEYTDFSDNSLKSAASVSPFMNSEDFSFDKLSILREMGKGNFGTVYHAVIADGNAQLAIKCIRLDVSEQTQRQISSEFEILQKCESNFIVRFFGSFFTENQINLCMEYMDGGSLSNYGVIANEDVLGVIAYSVSHGLRYLWSMRILHRDVKPSNILVSSFGDIKLCDFGVSTQLVRSIAQTFVGTVAYMAPERLRGEQYNELADVWSLGMSVFELATGRLPYSENISGNSENGTSFSMQLVYQLSAQCPISLGDAQIGRKFSRELVDFVDSCIQREGKKRLQPIVLHAHSFVVRHGDAISNRQSIVQWLRNAKLTT